MALLKEIDDAVRFLNSSLARNEDGGYAAVKIGDRSGIWTTAEVLRVLLTLEETFGRTYLSSQNLTNTIEFILKCQHPKEGWWPLIRSPPGSVIATSEVLMALSRVLPKVKDGNLKQKITIAINLGRKWLINAKNDDGGWGIEKDDDEEGRRSRVISTGYAIRALIALGEDHHNSKIIRNGVKFLVKLHTKEGGFKPVEAATTPDICATARVIEALLDSKAYEPKSRIIQRAIRFMIKQRGPALIWDVSSEQITLRVHMLTIHNLTPIHVAVSMIKANYFGLELIHVLKWVLDTQEDGYWKLRSPVTCLIQDMVTWVTAGTLYFLNLAEKFFHKELRSLLFTSMDSLKEDRVQIETLPPELAILSKDIEISDRTMIVFAKRPHNIFTGKRFGDLMSIAVVALAVPLYVVLWVLCEHNLMANIPLKLSLATISVFVAIELIAYARAGRIDSVKHMRDDVFWTLLLGIIAIIIAIISIL